MPPPPPPCCIGAGGGGLLTGTGGGARIAGRDERLRGMMLDFNLNARFQPRRNSQICEKTQMPNNTSHKDDKPLECLEYTCGGNPFRSESLLHTEAKSLRH